jgi:hypothetical protein
MNEENASTIDAETLAKGRSHFWLMAVASMLIHGLLLVEEVITWNSLGFVITELVFCGLLTGLWIYVGKTGNTRWLLFMVLLASGAFGFLLGGLHLKDPKYEAIDPLCYWLSIAGLALLGIGGYFIYSFEIDAHLRRLRGDQA